MMTWAWTLQWMLLNEFGRPMGSGLTMLYVRELASQLTPWEYNYSELMWRFGGELP